MIKAYIAVNGQFVGGWNTYKEAAAATGAERGAIGKAIRGERHTAGGYVWRESPDWAAMDIKKATLEELKIAYNALQRDIDPFLDDGCYSSWTLNELRQTQNRIAKEIDLRQALEGLNS